MRTFKLSRAAAILLSLPVALGGFASFAFGQTNPPGEDGPTKQITLTQKQIDGLVASQKEVQPLEEKMNGSDKPDPAVEAKLADLVKKYGFADLPEYGAASFSVGVVLAGVDPETKSYVGPTAVLKKQIAEVKADAKMPPKEKKDALAELDQALKSAGSDSAKPMAGNVDIVTKNFEKLTAATQQDSN